MNMQSSKPRNQEKRLGYLRRMVNEGLLERTTKTNRNYFVTRSAAELLRDAG